jgi:integrase/recombinase XerD
MNTLRQAVDEYLKMRRSLGFQLREAGKALCDFVTFMEQRRAPYITQALALAWAQQPASARPAYWAQRLSYVRGFAHYRSSSDPRTQIPPPGLLPFQPKRARPICTRMKRSKTYWMPPATCHTVTKAAHYCPGSTIVCSGC